jgi:hypothetical protein
MSESRPTVPGFYVHTREGADITIDVSSDQLDERLDGFNPLIATLDGAEYHFSVGRSDSGGYVRLHHEWALDPDGDPLNIAEYKLRDVQMVYSATRAHRYTGWLTSITRHDLNLPETAPDDPAERVLPYYVPTSVEVSYLPTRVYIDIFPKQDEGGDL